MEDVEKFLRCLMSKGVLAMEILNGEGAEAFRHVSFLYLERSSATCLCQEGKGTSALLFRWDLVRPTQLSGVNTQPSWLFCLPKQFMERDISS